MSGICHELLIGAILLEQFFIFKSSKFQFYFMKYLEIYPIVLWRIDIGIHNKLLIISPINDTCFGP
jgi:hypothetical protein